MFVLYIYRCIEINRESVKHTTCIVYCIKLFFITTNFAYNKYKF